MSEHFDNDERAAGRRELGDDELVELAETLDQAVRRYSPPWLRGDREDLVQAAVVRIAELWRNSERTEPPSRPYLQRVAYTAIAAEIRRIRRRGEAPLEAEDVPQRPDGKALPPDRAALSAQLGAAIRACVDTLRGHRRLAVILHLHGYPRDAIARTLDWGLRQVDNNQHRGMQDLRECLRGKGFAP